MIQALVLFEVVNGRLCVHITSVRCKIFPAFIANGKVEVTRGVGEVRLDEKRLL